MPIDRTSIITGPGFIKIGTLALLAADDIQTTLTTQTFDIQSNGYGKIGSRKQDFSAETTFTPLHWDNLAALFPYATAQIGTQIYGATDTPLELIPRNGPSSGYKFLATAVTKMPDITLSAIKSALGSMTLTSILKNNGDPSTLDDYYILADVGTFPTPDLTKIPNCRYTATWGDLLPPFTCDVDGPFVVSPEITTDPLIADGYGTIGSLFGGASCSVKVTPVGLSVAQLRSVSAAVDVGQDLPTADLVITGERTGAPVITIKGAQLTTSAARFGNNVKRVGEITFQTVRTATSGALDPLWLIATA
jgi:hypothetical protein